MFSVQHRGFRGDLQAQPPKTTLSQAFDVIVFGAVSSSVMHDYKAHFSVQISVIALFDDSC